MGRGEPGKLPGRPVERAEELNKVGEWGVVNPHEPAGVPGRRGHMVAITIE